MTRIRHTVAFALPFAPGTSEEEAFLAAGRRLATIQGVQGFTVLRRLEQGSELPLSFSMDFADRAAYEAYNAHPMHRSFVEERWATTVTAFVETDYAVDPDAGSGTSA